MTSSTHKQSEFKTNIRNTPAHVFGIICFDFGF